MTLNVIGLGLAAGGVWQYGLRYNSGIALANINVAILVRNEIFGRLLYLFVNTFFAKVQIHSETYGKETIDVLSSSSGPR